ncbi:MAG: hypothetical protein ACFFBH_15175 [Promethearchaeota archaeon]
MTKTVLLIFAIILNISGVVALTVFGLIFGTTLSLQLQLPPNL